jgi:D-alanyl-D-alanine carboxypeptidase
MATQRAGALSARAGCARVVLAVLVVMLGLVAPQAVATSAHAAPPRSAAAVADTHLTSLLRADLEAYLRERGAAEHASAAGLSVSLPGREDGIDVSAGTTTFGGSLPVGPEALWQVGSNTKAFTSVLLLQLEAEHELSIDDPLGRWLPEYPQWQDVSIRRLLNMTSGIATYDEQPAFRAAYVADPFRYFAAEQLVDYAVDAPATSGYSYSNTNYVLAEMIIERVTGHSYRDELETRLIEPLDLDDLHYRAHLYPSSVICRQPAGYFANDQMPGWEGMLGRDASRDSLSWARGTAGIIGELDDMTEWERALYSAALLPAEQQDEMTSLVSTQTGQPIEQTSLDDPTGFGLGVAQLTAPGLGTAWYYEGGTVGFRMLHIYVPESGLILAMALNSATDDDGIQFLLESVFTTLVEQGVVPAPAAAAAA